MSEAQVRADLHRVDAEEAAEDDREITCEDENDEDNMVRLDDTSQGANAQGATVTKRLTQATFVITGLQIEEAQ